MTQEDKAWLDARPNVLGNTGQSREELVQLFDIYNRLTGENMKFTTCGRCVLNVKNRIKMYYDKERD